MTRRGSVVVTVFLIIFFLFLVVIGFILLTVQQTASERGQPQASIAYDDAQANVALLGLLRQPFPADLDGDGTSDAGSTIADAIALDDPALDAQLNETIARRLPASVCSEPSTPCRLTITWPDTRTIDIDRFDAYETWIVPVAARLPGTRGQVIVELRLGQQGSIDAARSAQKDASQYEK